MSDGVDGGVDEDGGMARSDTRSQERTMAVGGARGEAVDGGAVGTPARGPGSAFKARHAARRGCVAAMRRRRADRRARRGKRRLTGGPLMLAISEINLLPDENSSK
jgi:hypothetical protein